MKSLLVRSVPVGLSTVVTDAHPPGPTSSPLSGWKRTNRPGSRTALPVILICWSMSALGLNPWKTPRLSPPAPSSIQVCCHVMAARFPAERTGGSASSAPSRSTGRLPRRHSWLCTDSGRAFTPS